MNFLKKPKRLDAPSEAEQPLTNPAVQAEVAPQPAEGAAAIGTDVLQTAQQAAQQAITKGTQGLNAAFVQVKQTGKTAQQVSQQLSVDSLKRLQSLQGSVGSSIHNQSQQPIKAVGQALTHWQTEIAALGTSGMGVANALKDLPRTAQALAEEMPKLARRLKTAGTRLGDAPRSDADVMALLDKIPGTSKLGAKEIDIRTFLSDKHGSHIHAHAKGGGNGAKNIVWEVGADNVRRGARTITGKEQLYIRFHNATDSVLRNSTTIAKLGLATTGTAVLTQAIVTALAYTLDLHRGDITVKEFKDRIKEAAISAGIATPVFFLIFIAVTALVPEVAVILAAPAVVAGFNGLFGVGIALPIIQSLIRHVKADSPSGEIEAQDETLALPQAE
jgi:hypothetical protein